MAKRKLVEAYNKKDLVGYLKNDFVLRELQKHLSDSAFASQRWLLDIPAKRLIYADVYGALLKTRGKKILDIGGGFCGLSRELIKNHHYVLVDTIDHDDHKRLKKVEKEIGRAFWLNQDWTDFKVKNNFDYIIVNDLFPNVDERLKFFIRKFRPRAGRLIVTLTCHEGDRAYKVKRVDADEILTIVPWNAVITSQVLTESSGQEIKLIPAQPKKSIFANGRSVYKIVL